jgi:uncharacterized protein (TIGR03790 family)
MNFFKKWLEILLLGLLPAVARAGGDEVVVIYNSRMPESLAVAQHYAAVRQVPTNHLFGFALTTNEVITRADFTDFLQKPLAEQLERRGLWKFGKAEIAANPNQSAHTEDRVVEAKFRYAVLCYGVPLKIAPSSELEVVIEKLTPDKFRVNEAAVDSELAWLPLLKMKVPLTGFLPNLFYTCTNRALLSPQNGLLLVSRLDGPTPEIAKGLVDKAVEAEKNGLWGRAYFDARGLQTNDSYYLGDQWMMTSAAIAHQAGFEVATDTNDATWSAAYPMSHIAIYAGWYVGDANGPFTLPKVEFMPGAFAYHLYSFSANTLRSTTSAWCGPLLAKGATCTMGCVYEPYLQFTPNIAFFLQAFCNGYTFGEAAWTSQNVLSWMTTVIGDPLYQPFNKNPSELHAQLASSQNPLIEWSFARLVNLDLARGLRPAQMSLFLENIPTTAHSAVLTEKLADLYALQGKPSSAIDTWQRALTLQPSPQQRLRLRLTLADKLAEQNRDADAVENYEQLLKESPDYAGAPAIREKLAALEKKVTTTKK